METISKTRNNMTVAKIVGTDICVAFNKWTQETASTQVAQALLTTAYPTLGSYSNIVYSAGPKASPITINGLVVMVPNFKSVTHIKVDREAFEGLPYEINGENRQYIFKKLQSGTPGQGTDWVSYYGLSNLVHLGLCLDPRDTWNAFLGNAPAFTKAGLLSDASLLGFKDSFNVLSFIAQLKELRDLPKLLTKWTRTSHDVSDKFLGVQFGLLPFVSDVKSIVDRTANLGSSIDKWNSLAAKCKVLNSHRYYPITGRGNNIGTEKDPIWETKASFPHSGGSCKTSIAGANDVWANHVVRQTIKAIVHVYFVPVNIPNSEIGALKRSIWGVDRPLTAAWDLIPFSFVVDWFTDIGDLIHQFETQQPHLKFKLVSAGVSLKIVTEHEMFWGPNQTSSARGSVLTTYTNYFRSPLNPSSLLRAGYDYSSLQFKLLDQKQALLGSALMHQLLR